MSTDDVLLEPCGVAVPGARGEHEPADRYATDPGGTQVGEPWTVCWHCGVAMDDPLEVAAADEDAAGPWAHGYDADDGYYAPGPAGRDDVTSRHLDSIARRLAATVVAEAPERDPALARLQEARDWSAARGEFELADTQDRLLDMLRAQASTSAARDDVVVPLQRERGDERER